MMSDTINYRQYKRENQGYGYIMVLIDVFSKKSYTFPMKKLTEFEAVIALEKMLDRLPDIPQTIITDKGTEYYNSKVQSLFQRMGIRHYSIRTKHKACVAERFIKTLKSRLEKYFWKSKSHDWFSVLEDFTKNYNETFHRSIKMTPNQVNENNRLQVYKNLYPLSKDQSRPRLQRGDRVRILKEKNIFEKGYSRSWSLDIYKVTKTFSDSGVDYYQISDLFDNKLPKYKYFWELNLVSKNDSNTLR